MDEVEILVLIKSYVDGLAFGGGSGSVPDATALIKGVMTLGATGGAARYGQKGDVGLGNVTNESKATMFTNAALTGNPTAPTPDVSSNGNRLATTEYVWNVMANVAGVELFGHVMYLGDGGNTAVVHFPGSVLAVWVYFLGGNFDPYQALITPYTISLQDHETGALANVVWGMDNRSLEITVESGQGGTVLNNYDTYYGCLTVSGSLQ